jgi:hypothetical protein
LIIQISEVRHHSFIQLPDLKFWRGVLVAAFLAVISAFVATVRPFDHFGGISLALIAGMLTKAFFWKRTSGSGGLAFAAKTLLRVGIVLLGLRLNFAVLAYSGTEVVAFDLLMVILGVALFMFVLRRAGFEPSLAPLAAVGSSICGASAIAAAAPGHPSKQREFRVSYCGLYSDRYHRNILGNPVAEYRRSGSREVRNFGRSNPARSRASRRCRNTGPGRFPNRDRGKIVARGFSRASDRGITMDTTKSFRR